MLVLWLGAFIVKYCNLINLMIVFFFFSFSVAINYLNSVPESGEAGGGGAAETKQVRVRAG